MCVTTWHDDFTLESAASTSTRAAPVASAAAVMTSPSVTLWRPRIGGIRQALSHLRPHQLGGPVPACSKAVARAAALEPRVAT